MERDGLRVGKITAIYYEKGTARVTYDDRNKAVSKELPFLFSEIFPYKIDDLVWTARLSSNRADGIIIGLANSEVTPPAEGKDGLYRKDFSRTVGDAYIRYDPDEKELKVETTGKIKLICGKDAEVSIEGNAKVTISGNANTTVSGNLTVTAASGDITVAGISLCNHTHTCPDGTTSKPQ